jgi:hypothetical protein
MCAAHAQRFCIFALLMTGILFSYFAFFGKNAFLWSAAGAGFSSTILEKGPDDDRDQ